MAERKQKVSIPLTVLSVLIAVIVVFPIVWMVLSSFKPSGELFSYPLHLFSQDPTVEHYASVLAGGFMGYVKNSLFLAVVGTLITLVISSMCGYALAIYRFEIKYVNLVFGVFLLGTLIPGETLTVPQFSVISALGLYNNIWGVILPVVTDHRYLHVPSALYVHPALFRGGRAHRRCERAADLHSHHVPARFVRHRDAHHFSALCGAGTITFCRCWCCLIKKNTPSRSPSKTLSAIWALTGALSWQPPCCPSYPSS